MSKASGSEDEPLVPDDFDDDFYKELCEKIPEVRQKLYFVVFSALRSNTSVTFITSL